MSKNGKELKNINQDTNTSINSYNPKITYYETQPSNNSNLFKTSSNFYPYSHNNNFNSTLQSFDNKNKLKDYIIYLKSNLNSSYYANNDLNNEYNKLLNKLYKLNERIKNYNKEYDEMIISYEKNLEKNNKLKKDYNILIEEYKLCNSNTEQKIKDLYDIKNKLENDINIKTNENNNLIKDIKNKTEKIENLKNFMKLFNMNISLSKEKNKLLEIKEIKDKNEELVLNKNKLKNELLEKENTIIKYNKINDELSEEIKKLRYNSNTSEDKLNNNIPNYEELIFEENKNSTEINKKIIQNKILLKEIKQYLEKNNKNINPNEPNNIMINNNQILENDNSKIEPKISYQQKESQIEIISSPKSGKNIYTINKEGKLLSYSFDSKKYFYINTSLIKGWQTFYYSYIKNSEGSLLLNTLSGLFILTGNNYNKLYYYSQSKNDIFFIKSFQNNHKYGGMLLNNEGNKLYILGGMYTKAVEFFDIKNNSCGNLSNLITQRINSGYNILNNEYIIVFFGEGNNTIEMFDLNSNNNKENNKWIFIDYKSNIKIKELEGFMTYNMDDNVIILTGGKNNDKIMIFYLKEKYLDVTGIKINDNYEFFFGKEKCFNTIYNNNDNKNIIGMDIDGNIHCFNNDYEYNIFIFD